MFIKWALLDSPALSLATKKTLISSAQDLVTKLKRPLMAFKRTVATADSDTMRAKEVTEVSLERFFLSSWMNISRRPC